MAKLNAHGHRKVAQFVLTLPEGYELTPGHVLDAPLDKRFALRSDGVVLKSHRSPGGETPYDRRWSGWSTAGRLKDADTVAQMRTRFAQLRDLYVAKHADHVGPITTA